MKWMKIVASAVLVTVVPLAMAARPIENTSDMVINLRGLAAECSLMNVRLDLAMPPHASAKRISQSLDQSKACVNDGLVKGKDVYRKGLLVSAGAKSQVSSIYARWLDYMHTLEGGYHGEGQDIAEARLNEAISDLQADLDAQNL